MLMVVVNLGVVEVENGLVVLGSKHGLVVLGDDVVAGLVGILGASVVEAHELVVVAAVVVVVVVDYMPGCCCCCCC